MSKVPPDSTLPNRILEEDFLYFFCHQSMQEFLAACFIAEMKLKKFKSFTAIEIMGEKAFEYWAVVIQYLSGIILNSEISMDGKLLKSKYCIYELCSCSKIRYLLFSFSSHASFMFLKIFQFLWKRWPYGVSLFAFSSFLKVDPCFKCYRFSLTYTNMKWWGMGKYTMWFSTVRMLSLRNRTSLKIMKYG